MKAARAVALGLALAIASGCAAEGTRATSANDSTFCAARARIDALKAEHRKASKQTVKLTLSSPVMVQPLSARGAVAVDPPGSLRMILLGPGGATALDLWVHGDAYRFSIPALGKVLRGDAKTPATKRKGLPVDFLRWWMLDPFGGELVYATTSDHGLDFVLRDRRADGSSAYVDGVVLPDGSVDATRTTWNENGDKLDEEHLGASSVGCGNVTYTQASTELTVEAICESDSPEVNTKAFVDPDGEAGTSPPPVRPVDPGSPIATPPPTPVKAP